MKLYAKNLILNLSSPKIMGILNITPDSFFDGNKYNNLSKALKHTDNMIKAGATIIDVGGQSTRPGSSTISKNEELDRVIPIIDAISNRFEVFISVDTFTPEVMYHSILCGAHMINDIYSLKTKSSLHIAKKYKVAVCIMHMKGTHLFVHEKISYNNLLKEINVFFEKKIVHCVTHGIKKKDY